MARSAALVLGLLLLACSPATAPTARSTMAAATIVSTVPEPTVQVGTVRSHPIPVGTAAGAPGDRYIAVLDWIRPATRQMLPLNSAAPAGKEWALVVLSYGCGASTDDVCAFHPKRFRLVGRKGATIDAPVLAQVPDDVTPYRELFGGAEPVTAHVGFLVDRSDGDFVLIWDQAEYEPIYFELEPAP